MLRGQQAGKPVIPVHAVDEHGAVRGDVLVEASFVQVRRGVVFLLVELPAAFAPCQVLRLQIAPVHLRLTVPTIVLAVSLHESLELFRLDQLVRQQLEHVFCPLPDVAGTREAKHQRAQTLRQPLLLDALPHLLHLDFCVCERGLHVAEWGVQERSGEAIRKQALPQPLREREKKDGEEEGKGEAMKMITLTCQINRPRERAFVRVS